MKQKTRLGWRFDLVDGPCAGSWLRILEPADQPTVRYVVDGKPVIYRRHRVGTVTHKGVTYDKYVYQFDPEASD